ncbi:MAG: alginate lyase family protein [Saprospiraceae bacterium]
MIIRYLNSVILLIVLCGCKNSNNEGWQELYSVADVWTSQSERIRELFQALDLQQPALEHVKAALTAGDTIKAGEALLDHYRNSDRSWVTTALDPLSYDDAAPQANLLLKDSAIIQDVTIGIPRRADGGWQWDYTGPRLDDEFGYSLNGHKYLPSLYVAWRESGNPEYLVALERIMQDWIIHHPLPPATDSIYVVLDPSKNIDWRDIGEVEWRTLEAGNRLGATWPQLFYAFQSEEGFHPATRLLMLSSLYDQATYLRKYHKSGHNWTTMEMNGLALTALAFPEFRDAPEWEQYALQVMSEEINRQVYPDGVQSEISTKTQWVALNRFESVADHFLKAGREVSPEYMSRLEDMYNYLAYSMRPDGHQPINNDSDREDLRPRVLVAAEKFGRPDWEWIATNGKQGTEPESAPTVTFPWAGIHVMRNGWQANAHWSFFDTGPYGTGHQHRDKLHLSVAAYGKDLLVDGGRYTHQDYFSFDPAIWRGYFRSSFSHNVILVDGKGQNAGPVRTDLPLSEEQQLVNHHKYDYAYGTFSDGFEDVAGDINHTRSLLYVRDRFWVVLDQIITDRPRKLQALWHFAPDCTVTRDGQDVVSNNPEQANLRIMPLGPVNWEVEIVSGQEKPFIQGWYSENYGIKEPNPTSVYTTNIPQSSTFAWLLVPADGTVPAVNARYQEEAGVISLSVTQEGQAPVNIRLPLDQTIAKLKVE